VDPLGNLALGVTSCINLNDFEMGFLLGYLKGDLKSMIQGLKDFFMFMEVKPIIPSISQIRMLVGNPFIDPLFPEPSIPRIEILKGFISD
jgi:hypothetical protein